MRGLRSLFWTLLLSVLTLDVSISNALSGSLTLLGQYNTPGSAAGVTVSGAYACVGDGTAGLQVINVSNPAAPTLAGTYNTDGVALRLTVAGNYVYLGDRQGGLKVINVSNPANPTLTGQFIATDFGTQFAIDVAVQNNIAYVIYDFLGLKIVNVANPANPQLLKGIGTPSWAQNAVPIGNYLYLTYATGLMVIDISNPATAQQVSTLSLPGSTFGHAVAGRYLYTASWGFGHHIVDINTPSSPQLITSSAASAGLSRQIVIEGQYANVANANGVAVMDISDPLAPVLVSSYAIPGEGADIAVNNGLIYVAAGEAGLLIFQLTFNPTPNTFTDVTAQVGLSDAGSGWAHGASLGDYDGDGDLDLYVGKGGNGTGTFGANRLYRNNGDGTFTDVAASAGVNDNGGAHAPVWGDYDNDGDLDLYLVNFLNGNNRLYRNNSNGTFTDVAAGAGIVVSNDGRGAAWGDYNNDGHLDLFINGSTKYLYRNNGNGTFTSAAGTAGINDGGEGFGTAWGDYDNDGDPDLLVSVTAANRLYRNNNNGTFTEVGASAGLAGAGHGSGAWGDYDNDGDLDLLIATEAGGGTPNRLYRNNGNGTFTDVSASAGMNINGPFFGSDAKWADYDNDGDLDVHISNIDGQGNRLYRNNGDGIFTEVTATMGIRLSNWNAGSSWGDYDEDGDLDLYIGTENGGRLYRNEHTGNRWLVVKTIGTLSNRSGIGAQVTAWSGSLRQRRDVEGDGYIAAQPSLPVEFGFGSSTLIDSLIIRWPSGMVQKLTNVATNQILTVVEAETPAPPPSLVLLRAGVAFGAPGDTLSIPVSMTGADPVAGLQFNLIARTDYARFVGMADTPRPGGFDRSAFPHDDTTRFVVFSGARALIPPGADIPILTARYLLHSTAPLGSTTPLVFTAVEISDSAGFAFHDSTLNSQLQTGLRGDLNLDGRVSILDVVRLARALVGQDTAPDSGSVFFHIADANGDGRITIGDIIVQVNIILGIPPGPPPVKALSATVTVRSGAPIGQDDGTLAAPIYLEPEGLVAGLSASFLLEGGLGVGTARVSGGSSGFGVASHSVGDMLRVWPSAWTGDGRWARGKTR